ncbi:MAG: Redoxin domain protein [Bryobacterales bacterium]|nr:Redoxin domain protein [Bryobacterales bacterium]
MCALGSGELSGRRAPGFSLPDSTGKQHDPLDYRGKVLIIDFMQVTCDHCIKFSAILEQARIRYGDKIAVLSIVNPPSEQKGVADYIAKNKIKSPILFDCGQVAFSYLKPTSPNIQIPHVFLIDADGTIRNDFGFGAATTAIFEGKGLFTELDKMLAAKPAGSPKK